MEIIKSLLLKIYAWRIEILLGLMFLITMVLNLAIPSFYRDFAYLTNINDVVVSLLPMVITFSTLLVSISDQKIYGIRRINFGILKNKSEYKLVNKLIIAIACFALVLISKIFNLGLVYISLEAVSIYIAIDFVLTERKYVLLNFDNLAKIAKNRFVDYIDNDINGAFIIHHIVGSLITRKQCYKLYNALKDDLDDFSLIKRLYQYVVNVIEDRINSKIYQESPVYSEGIITNSFIEFILDDLDYLKILIDVNDINNDQRLTLLNLEIDAYSKLLDLSSLIGDNKSQELIIADMVNKHISEFAIIEEQYNSLGYNVIFLSRMLFSSNYKDQLIYYLMSYDGFGKTYSICLLLLYFFSHIRECVISKTPLDINKYQILIDLAKNTKITIQNELRDLLFGVRYFESKCISNKRESPLLIEISKWMYVSLLMINCKPINDVGDEFMQYLNELLYKNELSFKLDENQIVDYINLIDDLYHSIVKKEVIKNDLLLHDQRFEKYVLNQNRLLLETSKNISKELNDKISESILCYRKHSDIKPNKGELLLNIDDEHQIYNVYKHLNNELIYRLSLHARKNFITNQHTIKQMKNNCKKFHDGIILYPIMQDNYEEKNVTKVVRYIDGLRQNNICRKWNCNYLCFIPKDAIVFDVEISEVKIDNMFSKYEQINIGFMLEDSKKKIIRVKYRYNLKADLQKGIKIILN